MKTLAEELAARRRFGVKPGLGPLAAVLASLGDPQKRVRALHVAGTNGKGAVCALLDAALSAAGRSTGRYTSPHLVSLNERFFLNGAPVSAERLDAAAAELAVRAPAGLADLTYFEYLTALAFDLYAAAHPDCTILETGLGGRLDATNLCVPKLAIITRIGLDHCDWLGDTLEKIAAEKAGIIKPGVPVVLGANAPEVRAVVRKRAAEVGAPFVYAPDAVSRDEIPSDLSLAGAFNRENAQTALAALKTLFPADSAAYAAARRGFAHAVWPGRFQRVGRFLVDGAHNPPAAHALAEALHDAFPGVRFELVAGFCGDKDVETVLRILAPFVARAFAVKTSNPRSLAAEEAARKMRAAGMVAQALPSLRDALDATRGPVLVCGSLFLAGDALVELGALPPPRGPRTLSEQIKPSINKESNT